MKLPEIYPDELLYSLWGRYYVRSGCLVYRQMAEKLFVNEAERPDVLFVNRLRTEIKEELEQQKEWKQIIQKHTMYPFYGKFLKAERKEQAFWALCKMEGNYRNLLPIGKTRQLCYCPLCVQEDREKYGETYWHRSHQLDGVGVCPYHGCYLKESGVMTATKVSPAFLTAELEIREEDAEMALPQEYEFAQYVCEVFGRERTTNTEIGQYLDFVLNETIYKSKRGKQRNISLLQSDYQEFWKSTSLETLEVWQIQKILTGYRFQTGEICGIAMFLGISPKALVVGEIPQKEGTTQVEKFDVMVRGMLKSGMGINETARRLQVSSKTIRDIRDYKKPAQTVARKRTRAIRNWEKEDEMMLPKVKEVLSELFGQTGKRPRRISAYAVNRMLGLPDGRIEKLQQCMEQIDLYKETNEEYWAREIQWAIDKIEKEGKVLNWKHIRDLTNMRKSYVGECFDLLNCKTQKKIQEVLYPKKN